MPSWKKVITSGSAAALNSLTVSNGITGSLYGTSSWAVSSSYASTSSYSLNPTISGSISLVDYINFNTASAYTLAEGRLGWDSGEGGLQLGMAGGNVQYALGEQLMQYCYNTEGTTLSKGQVVLISGSQGNKIAVKLADNSADSLSAGTLGFVAETITAGGNGWVITEGNLKKLNTIGLAPGALLYLGSTPGSYTQTIPQAPLHTVRLGYVERVHATVGAIYIKIDNGYELGELHDVIDSTTTSSYGDLLIKSGSVWINSKQLTGSYGLTGSLQATSFTGSFSGSHFGPLTGTASYASQALSASFSSTSSFLNSTTNAFIQNGNSFGTTALLGTNDNQSLAIETNGSEKMRITAAGDVGIGTSLPSASLHVKGAYTAATSASFLVQNSNASSSMAVFGDNKLKVYSPANGTSTVNLWSDNTTAYLGTSGIGAHISMAISTNTTTFSQAGFFQNGVSIVGSPWYGYVLNLDKGIYIADDYLRFGTGRIDSSGSLGLGKTVPTAKLDISGSALITGSLTVTNGITGSLFGTSSWAVSASWAPATTNAFVQNGNSFGTTALLGTNDNQSLAFETNGTTKMFISSSGNIGIGTTNPQGAIDVFGSDSRFGASNNGYIVISDDYIGGELGIVTNQDEGIAIKYSDGTFRYGGGSIYNPPIAVSASNVGIGTVTPSQLLEVNGNALIKTAFIGTISTFGDNYTSFSHISRTGSGDYSLLSDNAGITYLNAKSNQDIRFRINNIDKAILSSSGDFGIGTTTPNARLDVNGNAIITGSLTVTGKITAEEFYTEFVSSSIIYQSGSTKFGDSSDDVMSVTGSLRVEGSITGSLLGTASYATQALSASWAPPSTSAATASFVTSSNVYGPNGSNSILSASFAVSSSYAISSSNALTASYVLNAQSSSVANAVRISNNDTTSTPQYVGFVGAQSGTSTLFTDIDLTYVPSTNTLNATSSRAVSSSYAVSASNALTASFVVSSSYAVSSSNALTASFVVSSSYAVSASSTVSSSRAVSSSYAVSSSNALTASFVVTSSYAVSASNALTASFTSNINGTANYLAKFTGANTLSSSAIYDTGTNVMIGTTSPAGRLTVTPNGTGTGINGTAIYAYSNGGPTIDAGAANSSSIVATNNSINSATLVAQNIGSGPIFNLKNNADVNVLHVLNNGRVGIRNTTPNADLDVSGSAIITGSLRVVNGITGSLFGTSSWAVSASWAPATTTAATASFVTSSNVFGPNGSNSILSASFAISSSNAATASWATNVTNNGVTSVSASGTVSGITLGGGPITSTGTLTLSGTVSGLTNSNLSGTAGITNANLATPSLMIGTTNIALGATGSTLAGLTTVSSTAFSGSFSGSHFGPLTGNASTATTASYATTAGSVGSISANVANNTNNYVLTATGGSTVNGESNLRFDGSTLDILGDAQLNANYLRFDQSGTRSWNVRASGGNLNFNSGDSLGTFVFGTNTNINGTLSATVKSFIIDHPTKEGKKLQYGVLEGPEHSVYVRGKLTNNNTITLPDHWTGLVHEDTITVNLTPIGKRQDLWVETVTDTTITVGSDNEINCFYTVFAERKDIEKLVTEFDK